MKIVSFLTVLAIFLSPVNAQAKPTGEPFSPPSPPTLGAHVGKLAQKELLVLPGPARGASTAAKIVRYVSVSKKYEKQIKTWQAKKTRLLAPIETSGILGELTLPKSKTSENSIKFSIANIPGRVSTRGWEQDTRVLADPVPDFITLNEVFNRSTSDIERLLPAYSVVRGSPDNTPGGRGQSINNAVLYRTETWNKLAGGQIKVVNDDRGFLHGPFLWDRYAVWGVFKNKNTGAVVSVLSAHMPTNPAKTPKQWGHNALSRVGLYAKGMGIIRSMVSQLETYGPVYLAGDMNSHPQQGAWTAAGQMQASGYSFVKDTGVMYLFSKNASVTSYQKTIDSDHPALFATVTQAFEYNALDKTLASKPVKPALLR